MSDAFSANLDDQLAAYRKGLLARIWAGGVFIALLVLATGILGIIEGRTYLYVTVVVALAFVVAYLLRKHIPYRARIWLTLILFFVAGFTHFVDRGMFGAGYFLFVMGILLAAMLYSLKAGVIGIVLLAAILIADSIGFIYGWIIPPFDFDAQSMDVNEWMLFFTVVVLGSSLMLYAIGNYISAIQDLLNKVHTQGALTRQALEDLKQSQNQVVQLEKLASLGSLVAGVAHELNTPLGNALLSISAIEDRLQTMQSAVARGELRRSMLDQFFTDTVEMAQLASSASRRAASLVSSFKQIAVDQTSAQRRHFLLGEVIEDVLATVRPKYRDTPWQISAQIPSFIKCDSYPGPLGHALTNIVENALVHAFAGRESGTVTITAREKDGQVTILVKDNGVGMDSGTLAQAFNPFFTTRMGQGTSGLGLAVAHNIVLGILGGTLHATSQVGQGATFVITLPCSAPLVSGTETANNA